MDEASELAVALGACQAMQIAAENEAVTFKIDNMRLQAEAVVKDERILQLEIANVNIDTMLQEYRINQKSLNIQTDRG